MTRLAEIFFKKEKKEFILQMVEQSQSVISLYH